MGSQISGDPQSCHLSDTCGKKKRWVSRCGKELLEKRRRRREWTKNAWDSYSGQPKHTQVDGYLSPQAQEVGKNKNTKCTLSLDRKSVV